MKVRGKLGEASLAALSPEEQQVLIQFMMNL
jgi:hypothetical protein